MLTDIAIVEDAGLEFVTNAEGQLAVVVFEKGHFKLQIAEEMNLLIL